jgi:hypothetical protein
MGFRLSKVAVVEPPTAVEVPAIDVVGITNMELSMRVQ